MARGNGKQAKQAIQSGRLADFVNKNAGAAEAGSGKAYVDWAEVAPNLVLGAVYSLIRVGGAVLFGCSRDQTSYSVKLYLNGESNSYYFPCNQGGLQDLEVFLMGVTEAANADFDIL